MSYFGTDPGDLTADEMHGREPSPGAAPPCPSEGDEAPRCMVLIRNPGGDWHVANDGSLLSHAEAKARAEGLQAEGFEREIRVVGVLMFTSSVAAGRSGPSPKGNPMSESSVPVPRPSEPLTYEQEIHSLLYKARSWGRDLKAIFERERAIPGALRGEDRRINGICIENFTADLARIDAAIPLAEARRSPSAAPPEGIAAQEQRHAGVAVVEYFAARKAVGTEQTDAAKEGRLLSNDRCLTWPRYLVAQDKLWYALEKWAGLLRGENSQ